MADIKLRDLHYLVAVADTRHFGRAAAACHVSQPTLSAQLKKLEQYLGVQLIERGTRRASMTTAGERIVARARAMLEASDDIVEIAKSFADPLAGPLRLGVIHTIGPYLLPQLIHALKRVAPHMPLAIEENMTANLADMLRENEVDVVIIALPFDVPGILTRPIYDESFKVIVPRGHPWESKECIMPEEVAGDEVLLLKAGNCFRDQVLEVCPSCRNIGGLQRTLEGSSLETIRHMVATGLGVTVLPSSAADEMATQNPLVAVRPFTMPEPSRRVALAWRVTYPRNGAIDVLRAAILDSALPGVRPVGRAVPPGQVPWVDSR